MRSRPATRSPRAYGCAGGTRPRRRWVPALAASTGRAPFAALAARLGRQGRWPTSNRSCGASWSESTKTPRASRRCGTPSSTNCTSSSAIYDPPRHVIASGAGGGPPASTSASYEDVPPTSKPARRARTRRPAAGRRRPSTARRGAVRTPRTAVPAPPRLAMPHAGGDIEGGAVSPRRRPDPVTYLPAANPGEAGPGPSPGPRPAASLACDAGGASVCSRKPPPTPSTPTLVFDEVAAGIGGEPSPRSDGCCRRFGFASNQCCASHPSAQWPRSPGRRPWWKGCGTGRQGQAHLGTPTVVEATSASPSLSRRPRRVGESSHVRVPPAELLRPPVRVDRAAPAGHAADGSPPPLTV